MHDDKLHTYTTPRLRHMLSAQLDSRDWKLSDLVQIMEIIDELEREIAKREQVPSTSREIVKGMRNENVLLRDIPERY